MNTDLWGLFLSSFISSTLLPGGSEIILALLDHQQVHAPLVLIIVATTGNTLGGMTSWGIGRFVPGLDQKKYIQAIDHIHRWGAPVLLFSWLPIIGDPLCLIAGWLRIRWWHALIFIAVGKALRYLLIIVLI